jgi:sugar O-acyltransferase, sialic acid O-acetyltransferase NeuD family
MNKDLIIIGASGHGKVIADIATKMERWDNILFLDDDDSINSCMGFKVIGKSNDAYQHLDHADIFVAIGNNSIRERILDKLEDAGASIPILIHPNAVIGIDVEIGVGSVVMAGVVINSSTRVGKGCIINTSSSIDHDNYIEDYVHISPRVSLAGSVHVGKSSWLGVGSVVSNNVKICSGSTIGAGAVVISQIFEIGTYIGVPARRV